MSGLIFKSLMSLVQTKKKGADTVRPLLRVDDIKRSVDDITIPYLLPVNSIQPIRQGNNERYDITALVFLKMYQSTKIDRPQTVREANYWREFAPFWNSTDIKRLVWWKYFNEVTIVEAKQIVAREIMDKLYKDIFAKRIPVIGIRVVLYNGNTDEVIDPKLLRDPWFAEEGFNRQRVDRFQLRAWGIRYGDLEGDGVQTSRRPPDRINITNFNLDKTLAQYNIDLRDIIRDCVLSGERKVSRTMADRRIAMQIKRYVNQLISDRRLESQFKTFFVKKIQGSRAFSKEFAASSGKVALIRTLVQQIVDDLIDREIAKLVQQGKKKGPG